LAAGLSERVMHGQHRSLFWQGNNPSPRGESLAVVAISGAIGALIHAGSSFADYVGNRQLVWSWVWWLVFRIPIGVALALVFYLLIRGGLIIPNGSTEPQINPYGIGGLAALVGMFAKQATDTLAEIFDTLFRSEKDKLRSEALKPDVASNPLRPDAAAIREMGVMTGVRDESNNQ
jgi:hypothetical protein